MVRVGRRCTWTCACTVHVVYMHHHQQFFNFTLSYTLAYVNETRNITYHSPSPLSALCADKMRAHRRAKDERCILDGTRSWLTHDTGAGGDRTADAPQPSLLPLRPAGLKGCRRLVRSDAGATRCSRISSQPQPENSRLEQSSVPNNIFNGSHAKVSCDCGRDEKNRHRRIAKGTLCPSGV